MRGAPPTPSLLAIWDGAEGGAAEAATPAPPAATPVPPAPAGAGAAVAEDEAGGLLCAFDADLTTPTATRPAEGGGASGRGVWGAAIEEQAGPTGGPPSGCAVQAVGAGSSWRPEAGVGALTGMSARPAPVEKKVTFGGPPAAAPAAGGPGPAPATRAEERQADNEREARALIEAAGGAPAFVAAGAPGSRLERSEGERAATLVERLVQHGGVGGAKNRALRLFLADLRAAEPLVFGTELFPVSAADAEAVMQVLRREGKKTAAARVGPAMEYAESIGLPVRYDAALLGPGAGPRREKPAAALRDALPPLGVLLVERAAGGGDGQGGPRLEYTRHVHNMLLRGTRGANYVGADFQLPVGGVVRSTGELDGKSNRKEVALFMPLGGAVADVLEWQEEFAAGLAGRTFTCRAWSGRADLDGATWPVGPPTMAASKKAAAALAAAAAAALGLSRSEMAARRIAGTHTGRYVGPKVAALLDWPESDADVLGDWAPAPEEGAAGRGRGKRKVSARGAYVEPYHSEEKQLRVRRRYLAALRAAFGLFGVGNVSWETTWEELFPPGRPAELAEFYGPWPEGGSG